jgi:hypothetical protein
MISELDRGPLDIGFALAARDRGSPLPLETEDWTRVLPLDRLRSVPGFPRRSGPARKGGCRSPAGARTRNDTPILRRPQRRLSC